ncbi:MAG: hypothetical protein IPK22_16565 [Verrucomicrobiaceae bacterium]|nr:hypothetical protein [Verrucomicrobiaceae bacterium]
MRRPQLPCLLLATLILVSCGERAADVVNPKKYEKEGVVFLHPGNWTIENESHEAGFHHVTVESPGDALVVVQAFEQTAAVSLKEYAEGFSAATAKQLPMGKMDGHQFAELPDQGGWQRLQETLTMHLVGTKIPHTRFYYARDFGENRCFVLCQVSTEDLSRVQEGFAQIVKSTLVK